MDTSPHVIFELSGAHAAFALEVTYVVQALNMHEMKHVLAAVPLAPGPVRGIINHDGGIVTIIDPALLLGLPLQQNDTAQVLLLRSGQRRKGHLGLLVQQIVEIAPRSLMLPVDVQLGPCVSWAGRVRHRLVHVVSVQELLHGLGELFGPAERGELLGVDL